MADVDILFAKARKAIRIFYAIIKLRKGNMGKRISACRTLHVINPQYFTVGDNCFFGPDCRIEAWDSYNNLRFKPELVFGKDVRINSTCHIGAINRIIIGNECLFGSHVMVMDHSHGQNTYEESFVHPSKRDLFSKGEIVIGDRCWICENAVILPGVHIGECCVIGANAVVTKDIPPFSVVGGNPARVLKTIVPKDEDND